MHRLCERLSKTAYRSAEHVTVSHDERTRISSIAAPLTSGEDVHLHVRPKEAPMTAELHSGEVAATTQVVDRGRLEPE